MTGTPRKDGTGPMTVTRAAELLGVHVNTVVRIPPRDLPYFSFGSRGDRRYFPSDIEAYIERRMVR